MVDYYYILYLHTSWDYDDDISASMMWWFTMFVEFCRGMWWCGVVWCGVVGQGYMLMVCLSGHLGLCVGEYIRC